MITCKECLLVAVCAKCAATGGHVRECDYFVRDRNVPSWIPVAERLPDTSGDYLTRCHHYSNGDWTEVTPFDAEKNYFTDLGRHYYPFVTHWMPLPEPPKEVE